MYAVFPKSCNTVLKLFNQYAIKIFPRREEEKGMSSLHEKLHDKLGARFIADATIPDGTRIRPGDKVCDYY